MMEFVDGADSFCGLGSFFFLPLGITEATFPSASGCLPSLFFNMYPCQKPFRDFIHPKTATDLYLFQEYLKPQRPAVVRR